MNLFFSFLFFSLPLFLTFLKIKKKGLHSHPIKMTKTVICSYLGVGVAEQVSVVSPGDVERPKEKSGLITHLTAGNKKQIEQ